MTRRPVFGQEWLQKCNDEVEWEEVIMSTARLLHAAEDLFSSRDKRLHFQKPRSLFLRCLCSTVNRGSGSQKLRYKPTFTGGPCSLFPFNCTDFHSQFAFSLDHLCAYFSSQHGCTCLNQTMLWSNRSTCSFSLYADCPFCCLVVFSARILQQYQCELPERLE